MSAKWPDECIDGQTLCYVKTTINFIEIIEIELCRERSEDNYDDTIIDGPFPRDRLNAEVNRPEVHVKRLSPF